MKTLSWIPAIFSNKSFILMSIPAAFSYYLPAKLHPHLDDIAFVIIGWLFAIVLAFFDWLTKPARTSAGRQKKRNQFFSKAIIYTLLFFFLKFFHLWIIYDDHETLALVVNAFIIAIYALVCLGEMKFIGQNLEKKYGNKPNVFNLLESLENMIKDRIFKRAEKICNLDEIEVEEIEEDE